MRRISLRKILSIILVALLIVAMSACSKPVTEPPTPAPPAEKPAATEPTVPPAANLKPLEADSRGIYVLRQEDFIYFYDGVPRLSPEIVRIDGEQIEIVGFMAMFSPENANYIYLVRVPEIDCTFCLGSDPVDQIILTVYLEPGKTAKWVSGPIAVTGTLSMREIEDDSGMINYLNLLKAQIRSIK